MKRGRNTSKVSRFSASAVAEPEIKLIKIKGAGYEAVDTEDGYHTVKGVPIFAEIKRGTHGAPYDVTEAELVKFCDNMKSRYANGHKTGALSVGHNDDLGLTHPAFAGFFLPTHVGPCKMANGQVKATLFADLKIPNDKFADFAAGKLPMHSPEIYPQSWSDRKIDIISFLDTKPAYFDWAQNTVSKITKDPAAKFEASWEDPATADLKSRLLKENLKTLFGADLAAIASRFAAYAEKTEKSETTTKIKRDDDGKGETKEGDEKEPEKKGEEKPSGESEDKFASEYPETHTRMSSMAVTISKMAAHMGLDGVDSTNKKPDATPVEPTESVSTGGSKMSMDPATAAKFAAQQSEIVEIKAALAAKAREEKIGTFRAQADKKLAKKIVSSPEIIAKFAADAADMKEGGEKWFGETIDKLVPMLKDKPPSTVDEFMTASEPSADPANPVLSKFAAKGVDMNKVARFSAQFRQIKSSPMGRHLSFTEEAYIENELLQDAAAADRKE